MKYLAILILVSHLTLMATDKATNRAGRWEGQMRKCLDNFKQHKQAQESMKIHLICACVTTKMVNLCAPQDQTPTTEVQECISKNKDQYMFLFTECNEKMPLTVIETPKKK